jgi:hypothetical protein
MIKIIPALLFVIASCASAGTTFGLKSYKCAQDKSTGFIFVENEWKTTSFSTIEYILRPLGTDQYQYGLYQTEADEFPSICDWKNPLERNELRCTIDVLSDGSKGDMFLFGSKNNRYIRSSATAFLNHDSKSSNSAYLEIGSCQVTAVNK